MLPSTGVIFHPPRSTTLVLSCWSHLDDFWGCLLSPPSPPQCCSPWLFSLALQAAQPMFLQRALAAAPLGVVLLPCRCSSSLLWGNHFQELTERHRSFSSIHSCLNHTTIALFFPMLCSLCWLSSFLVHRFCILFKLSQNASINNSTYWLSLSYSNNY